MPGKKRNLSRRDFIKAAGAAGVGSILLPISASQAESSTDQPAQAKVPTRPFGKTGEQVSILSLGGTLNPSDQLVFRQAFKMGVTYWDTADSYKWGKNEKAIGKYFSRFPDDRKNVFIVTKTKSSDPRELTEAFTTSLQRMKTSYVDMYFIHYVKNVEKELTREVKAWAEKTKAEGKIRFFGFSAHKNMENSMLAAAKLGWVDGIMMSYNYRLMVKDDMKRAVDACVEAGIGLTAMKTQAAFSANFYSSIGSETDDALKLTERLIKKGYTAEQAKLKAVWDNPNIASICSAMPNMTILQANAAAAMNKTNLSRGDKERMDLYAHQTSSGYCAGCADICESAIQGSIPISDIMRCAMYLNGYDDRPKAAKLFREFPEQVRQMSVVADYHEAEKRCPHNIQIGKVIRQIHEELSQDHSEALT